jgi:hypothetical protein
MRPGTSPLCACVSCSCQQKRKELEREGRGKAKGCSFCVTFPTDQAPPHKDYRTEVLYWRLSLLCCLRQDLSNVLRWTRSLGCGPADLGRLGLHQSACDRHRLVRVYQRFGRNTICTRLISLSFSNRCRNRTRFNFPPAPSLSAATALFAHHVNKKITKRMMDRRPKKSRLSDINRKNSNFGKCITKQEGAPADYTIMSAEGKSARFQH